MKFSLIIPCYNEAANIPLLLDRCIELTKNPLYEVILVDNGSTDDTPDVLKRLLPHYPGCRSILVEENKGYGFGIISGLKAAKGDILGWTHADMQTDPTDALSGLRLFEKDGHSIFVKGKRYGRPISDIIFTIGMSFFETILLKKCLWDINAQPTLFSRDFFEKLKNPPNDFSLDLYAYYYAKKDNLSIKRFSVHFSKRAHGLSRWNINWKAKWKFILRTIHFSITLHRKFS